MAVPEHMIKKPNPYEVRCTFNPDLTCKQVMDLGNGHCCAEYAEYEQERSKEPRPQGSN